MTPEQNKQCQSKILRYETLIMQAIMMGDKILECEIRSEALRFLNNYSKLYTHN